LVGIGIGGAPSILKFAYFTITEKQEKSNWGKAPEFTANYSADFLQLHFRQLFAFF
jgi:hypothetical protein